MPAMKFGGSRGGESWLRDLAIGDYSSINRNQCPVDQCHINGLGTTE